MATVLALVTDRALPPTRTTAELLAASGEVAMLTGGSVAAATFGTHAPALAEALATCGAEVVYAVDHEWLDGTLPEADLAAFVAVSRASEAQHILLPADATGRNLAPRLAVRERLGIVTEVTGFAHDDGRLMARRPVYGGKAVAVLEVPPRAVVTIRARAFLPTPLRSAGRVEPIAVDCPPEARAVEVVERVREDRGGVDLEEARVVVAGGRGIGGREGFEVLNELARLLGGAVGGSRAATDAGWIPQSRQIGLTGRSIAPELYVAVGISGSSQHLAGVTGAQTIVAINIDPAAPIFKAAHLGVVGDWRPIVTGFIAALSAREQDALRR
jgi:electron transfer flavoprotein alpha subunit